jgi:hypothetical protein
MSEPSVPKQRPNRPVDCDFTEPSQAAGYWTTERLKRAKPMSFPDAPRDKPPAETGGERPCSGTDSP